MKYKVRFIKDSERSDVSFVFEETEPRPKTRLRRVLPTRLQKSSALVKALCASI